MRVLVVDESRERAAPRAICACFNVGEEAIRAVAQANGTLAGIQARLKCGTSWGSCLPELRRIVRSCEAKAVTP